VSFTEEQVLRYARQMILPEIGGEGQARLARARVLVVGLGGLGSPAATYLATAGVGTLGLVDHDRVDLSNLHRQPLHGTSDVGRAKVVSAAERLRELNPEVELEVHERALDAGNALEILAGYDVVVDGTDTFPARYLINDAAQLAGIPVAHGSVHRFEGQASVFLPGPETPCYRCLFPHPPEPDSVPSCAEAGVLGVLPGLVGTIQAAETIKLLTGVGETLAGRLLTIDALTMRFAGVAVRWDPGCAVCGRTPSLTELIDYDAFCGVVSASPSDAV